MEIITEKPLTMINNCVIMILRFNRNILRNGVDTMTLEKFSVPAARKNANLTQAALAAACGVSVSTVGNWENGKTEPTISQAMLIAKAVGVDLDNLIFLL